MFSSSVSSWFTETLGAPTAPQQAAWPLLCDGQDVVIAAPTGSGKTLAAFLHALDGLAKDVESGALTDEVQVVYVSPLRALSNDVGKNLLRPLRGVCARLGVPDDTIRVAVRTGDTPQKERQKLTRKAPHVLVTTPESLFVLLGSPSGQKLLRTARTLIVDEVHAVCGNRRGAHLALSVERLDALVTAHRGRPLQRVGLSATQKPIELVARYLSGAARAPAHIVDAGHKRALDLEIVLPDSALEAVMSTDVFMEIVRKLAALIEQHTTTLIFVNTRRLAERLMARLDEELAKGSVGAGAVRAHHGSMALSRRHDAETRLKAGTLRALVATSSMELGIDVGDIDLVCQLGSTKTIAALLQRVGRAGHQTTGTPKGRLFPLTRDELSEAAASIAAVDAGDLDALVIPDGGLDVLVQHLIAHTAAEQHPDGVRISDATALFRRALPFRQCDDSIFDKATKLASAGVDTGRGKRGDWLFHDSAQQALRPKKGARLAALTSGGVIPDMGDYTVVDQASDVVIGSVHEEFAVESLRGDVFQLGNASWRIERVDRGVLRVSDAQGQPATIPFWFGEAPARSPELSSHVSAVRELVVALCDDGADDEQVCRALMQRYRLPRDGAMQLAVYLRACYAALGTLPTKRRIVVERFDDDMGGTQLVIHAPFGARITRAWGLALRKRFCRSFDFELQAAATEDGVILSVGTIGGVDLNNLVRFVTPKNIEHVLEQAILGAPMFGTRFRHNATRALTVLRHRSGKRVPPGLVRIAAEDVLVSVFPEQVACPENLGGGDREIPDHPLVQQTIHDCLYEWMDIDGARAMLDELFAGTIEVRCVERAEPSPLAMELVTARPYAFLDDVPFEERRVQAVMARHQASAALADETVALDDDVINAVVHEAAPDAETQDEAWDLLTQAGFLRPDELSVFGPSMSLLVDELVRGGRAVVVHGVLVAVEQRALVEDPIHEHLMVLLRGRATLLAPRTLAAHRAQTPAPAHEVDVALARLVTEGVLLRGHFLKYESDEVMWARHLVVRARRRMLSRLREAIAPVSAEALMRFLVEHHHLKDDARFMGRSGLEAALRLLDGVTAPALSWEKELLAARVRGYSPADLDALCLSGAIVWRCKSGLVEKTAAQSKRNAPLQRQTALTLADFDTARWMFRAPPDVSALSASARAVIDVLAARGPTFSRDLSLYAQLDSSALVDVLREVVGQGVVVADGFGAVRGLAPYESSRPFDGAGRFSLAQPFDDPIGDDDRAERAAWLLLRRYGVAFRRLAERDPLIPPWRTLVQALRRLEVRGDVRGGRFINGFTGEQFALPEAVSALRRHREPPDDDALVVLAATDPLNLTGSVLPTPRIPAVIGARVVLRRGSVVMPTDDFTPQHLVTPPQAVYA